MTDKQIIIDGVDVSECIYFKMNNKMPMRRACNSGIGSPYCEYHKDCYYKQLKRLEQENEELKNILTNIDKKLELALDVEQTDAEESFDLLYTIQDLIREAIGE